MRKTAELQAAGSSHCTATSKGTFICVSNLEEGGTRYFRCIMPVGSRGSADASQGVASKRWPEVLSPSVFVRAMMQQVR